MTLDESNSHPELDLNRAYAFITPPAAPLSTSYGIDRVRQDYSDWSHLPCQMLIDDRFQAHGSHYISFPLEDHDRCTDHCSLPKQVLVLNGGCIASSSRCQADV